ncbi:nucleoside monophosphate kinase [Patescibacteria group bacterium]|nr:nucleoside monophosphate kinase [Patescibacteria group bacterium]
MKPNIHILGIQGSGKGTQSDLLHQKYGFNTVSSGALFRTRAAQSDEFGTYLAKELAVGHLIADTHLFALVEEYLQANPIPVGFVGDGVIRTAAQYEGLQPVWKRYDLDTPLLFYLDLSDTLAIQRIENRIRQSGGQRRSDDNPEGIAARFQAYHRQTAPVISLFEAAGRCIQIKADQSIEAIHAQIVSAIEKEYPWL